MIYKIFITENGLPKTELSPSWDSLATLDGTDKSGDGPTINEISSSNAPGWYKFEVTYGTTPFDVPELVGVIDAGSSLSNYERYIPVTISLRDLALDRQVAKATFDLATGVESIRNDADTGTELQLTRTVVDNVETRTPGNE